MSASVTQETNFNKQPKQSKIKTLIYVSLYILLFIFCVYKFLEINNIGSFDKLNTEQFLGLKKSDIFKIERGDILKGNTS